MQNSVPYLLQANPGVSTTAQIVFDIHPNRDTYWLEISDNQYPFEEPKYISIGEVPAYWEEH